MDGPPPTYTEEEGQAGGASLPTYTNEPPPSYNSVFGRVHSMREESSGNVDFGKKLVGCVLCGTVCGIITIVFMLAVPISCLVFGALYLGECPREKYIPIYLIVAGVFGIIKAIIGIAQMVVKHKARNDESSSENEEPSQVKALRIVDGPISCFLSAWFICGSVWVYRIHKEFSEIPGQPDYCNPTLYAFAFWIITMQYILMALAILCCCIGMIVACCVAGKGSNT